MHSINQEMKQCVQKCLDCYTVCRESAMNHCLETGGNHLEPHHFRLMTACAEICRTAADIMLDNSEFHGRVCAVCAEVCEACAQSCEEIGDMQDCAKACRQCAESCRRMAGAKPARSDESRPSARA